eukprot:COSAG01_NODE_1656_length_9595_cov_4.929150_10_plen_85_part_00
MSSSQEERRRRAEAAIWSHPWLLEAEAALEAQLQERRSELEHWRRTLSRVVATRAALPIVEDELERFAGAVSRPFPSWSRFHID